LAMGTDDFTIEMWVLKDDDDRGGVYQISADTGGLSTTLTGPGLAYHNNDGAKGWQILAAGGHTDVTYYITTGVWYHIAHVRTGGSSKLYVNGDLILTKSDTTDYSTSNLCIGGYYDTDHLHTGKISNFRVVKGTALYTSNFTPNFAALTNVTNTKLLCCQDTSSTTVGAVKPGTITAVGDPTASSNSIYPGVSSTLTWPSSITWNGGSAPTLASANSYNLTGQVFNLVTSDGGVSWYGHEEVNNTSSQPHTLWSWGSNSYGNLGHNQSTPTKISSPVQVGSDTIWKSVNIWGNSRFTSTAMKSADNTLWMWGYNDTGVLAQNNTTKYSSPVQIPGTTWGSVVLGGPQSWIGTKTDGTLWMAGGNGNGQLGQNSTTQYSSPVQIPGTTWASGTDKISYGNRQALAIKTDGTLWTWGEDTQGQLGQNELIERSSPVQIPGTTWSSVSSHHYANFATKTDGTLWAWGWNVWGVLGINIHYAPSNKGRSSPVQIPGTTWSSVSVNGGRYAAAAIKTDGTLWAWGLNGPGMLGQNDTVGHSSPVQIPGTTWSSVSSGAYHFTATKTDGTGWAWGYNAERGELGQNNLTNYSSPIQIPGTWSELQAGMYRTFGTKTP